MLPVRYSRSWLTIGWAMVAAATLVCLVPAQELPQTGIGDKYEHSIAYAALMLWFAGLYPRSRYVIIAFALFVMGVLIEFAQGAMHLGRTADARDVIANSIGIVIGLALAFMGLGGWAQWIDGWTRTREPARTD